VRLDREGREFETVQTDDDLGVMGFRRARRKATVEQILAWLRGRSPYLLCYTEIRDLLKTESSEPLGRQKIPLEAIAGSAERCTDYTRGFLPLKDSDQERWVGVQKALGGWRSLPPISVFRVDDVYFVIDGHHRVSVAREQGQTSIEAQVLEIRSRVSLSPDVQPDDLLLKAETAAFLKHTHLDETRPQADWSVTGLGQASALEAQIEAHRRSTAHTQRREVSTEEAASHWYDTVYLPVIRSIRQHGMAARFPGHTEANLYLRICEHRAALSQALGSEIALEVAAADLIRQQAGRRPSALAHARKRLLEALARLTPARR
jgi:hypothetical protein